MSQTAPNGLVQDILVPARREDTRNWNSEGSAVVQFSLLQHDHTSGKAPFQPRPVYVWAWLGSISQKVKLCSPRDLLLFRPEFPPEGIETGPRKRRGMLFLSAG